MGTAAGTGTGVGTGCVAREHFMHRAIAQARRSLAAGGPPVGAVLVRDNAIIAEARNAVIAETDVTAHAEIMLLRQACKEQRCFELPGDELYVTVEPCMMCFAACGYAGIGTVFFGAPIGRMANITGHELAVGHYADSEPQVPQLVGGVCSEECMALLDDWQTMRGAAER